MPPLTLRSEMSLALLAAANIVVAFVQQIVVLAAVGPGSETDALIAATTVPVTLVTIIAVAIPAVVVPRLAGLPRADQLAAAWPLTLRIGLLGLATASGLAALAAPVTALLFGGFAADTAALCARLLQVQAGTVVFAALSTVFTAVLAAQSRFVAAELATAAGALLTLALTFILVPRFGVDAAAWLQLARAALLAASLFFLTGPSTTGGAPHGALGGLGPELRPLLAGNAYFKTEVLVDRHLLSLAAPGDLSLYGIGQQVHMAASGILGKAWGSTAVTRLAECVRHNDRPAFVRVMHRNLALLLVGSAGGWALLAAVGVPLASLVLEAGRLTSDDLLRLWWLMVLLGGVLVGGALGTLLAGAHYALGDARTPTWMGAVSYTVFVAVKVMAFSTWSVAGLCVATSVYYMTNALLLALLLPRGLRRRFETAAP